jgi:hypothetical protein
MKALEPLHFSQLKKLARSPAHYACPEEEDTASLLRGRATHAYMLGQKHRVVLYEDGKRDLRQEKYRDFVAAHPDSEILIPSEMADVAGMRASLERHPRAMELLEGEQERTIQWDIGGRRCEGTPDVLRLFTDRKRLVELKTDQCSAPDLFKWKARRRYFYHAQVDWYSNGCELTMSYPQLPVDEHFVIAVESKPPYPVTVFNVRESILKAGRKQWRIWFEQLRTCEASNTFPPYVQSDVDWEDEEGDFELDWDEEAA